MTIKKFKLKTGKKLYVDPEILEKYRNAVQKDRKRELFREIKKQNKDAKRARKNQRRDLRKVLKDRAPMKEIPKTKRKNATP